MKKDYIEEETIIKEDGAIIKIILESVYIPYKDITIIFEEIWKDDFPKSTKIRGFYYGEPNEENTKQFKDKGVVCIYE